MLSLMVNLQCRNLEVLADSKLRGFLLLLTDYLAVAVAPDLPGCRTAASSSHSKHKSKHASVCCLDAILLCTSAPRGRGDDGEVETASECQI